MKKCACTAHAETHLPPDQRIRAPSTWKSARTATHSLPASRSWWTPPDAWSASAGSMQSPMPARPRQQRPQRPSNKAANLIEGLRHGGGFVVGLTTKDTKEHEDE